MLTIFGGSVFGYVPQIMKKKHEKHKVFEITSTICDGAVPSFWDTFPSAETQEVDMPTTNLDQKNGNSKSKIIGQRL